MNQERRIGIHEFGDEYLMCEHQPEQERKKQEQPITPTVSRRILEGEPPYSIKVEVEGIGLECMINGSDPVDVVILAGAITSHLRKCGKEPKVVILP